MPIHSSFDSNGFYYQWGNHGAKYYYTPRDDISEHNAYAKARMQAMAAYAHGYKGGFFQPYHINNTLGDFGINQENYYRKMMKNKIVQNDLTYQDELKHLVPISI